MKNWSRDAIDLANEVKVYEAKYNNLLGHFQQQMVDLHASDKIMADQASQIEVLNALLDHDKVAIRKVVSRC